MWPYALLGPWEYNACAHELEISAEIESCCGYVITRCFCAHTPICLLVYLSAIATLYLFFSVYVHVSLFDVTYVCTYYVCTCSQAKELPEYVGHVVALKGASINEFQGKNLSLPRSGSMSVSNFILHTTLWVHDCVEILRGRLHDRIIACFLLVRSVLTKFCHEGDAFFIFSLCIVYT